MVSMSHTMDTQTALELLQSAVDRYRFEDVDRHQANAASDFLESRATVKWPLDQFRAALNSNPGEDWEIEGRRQILNASLNGIRRVAAPSRG